MKLSEIENPMVMDSSKPIYIKTSLGRAKVVGFTPRMYIGGEVDMVIDSHWHVLLEGDKEWNLKGVFDGEIIEGE